jgi:hypothetical protein
MRARSPSLLAWGCWALSTLLGVSALILMVANGTTLRGFLTDTLPIGAELAIIFPIVGVLIVTARPGNPVGWIFCVIGLSQGLVEASFQYATFAYETRSDPSLPLAGVAAWLNLWVWMPGFGSLLTFLPLFFPDGRLPSKRWRPVAWLTGVAFVGMGVFAVGTLGRGGAAMFTDRSLSFGPVELFLEGAFQLLLLCALASIASVIVRFRRVGGVERLQLKWFTYAVTTVVLFALLIESQLGPELGPEWRVAATLLGMLLIPTVPAATAIAILRYRLYEIDRIINRTLVYGLLTALLVTGYAGAVLLLRSVLPLPDDSPVVVAGSTLAMAALFGPLRGRVQRLVDSRFYRSRYDAQRTVEGFAERLRRQTDLDALTGDLLSVVGRTVHPASASVWLSGESLSEAAPSRFGGVS